ALSLVIALACSLLGQQPPADITSQAAELLAFEREMEAAVVRGDVPFLDRICAGDFTFTHGDGWVTGGKPLRVENKSEWLLAVGKRPYLSRELASVQVELHGDIAITYGMYRARNRMPSDPTRREFTVWFERSMRDATVSGSTCPIEL